MVSSVNSSSTPLVHTAYSGTGVKEPVINPITPNDATKYQDKVTITGVTEKSPVYEPMVGGGTTQPDPKIQQTE